MENVSIIYSKFDGVNKLSGINKKIRDSGLNIDEMIETSSSAVYNNELPSNTLHVNNYPFTTTSADYFITYHFVGRKIYLENYSILTDVNKGKNEHHPQNWIVHGSNDNENWKMIDIRHTSILNSRNQSETFKCKKPRAFSYIRIKNIGPNYINSLTLRFQQIEFFGTLFPEKYNFFPENCIMTMYHKRGYYQNTSIFVYIFLCS